MLAVKRLYRYGNSAQEIKELLHLSVDVRTIQRRLAQLKLTRTVKDSYHIAIAKGRMKWDWDFNQAAKKAQETIYKNFLDKTK